MRRLTLTLTLAGLLLVPVGVQAGSSTDEVNLTVSAGGPILETVDGMARFRIPEGGCWSFTWEPGYPRLPVKRVWVLLPPDALPESVALTSAARGVNTLSPGEKLEVTQLPGIEVPAATGAKGELWPECWARVAGAGQFRKYRYALVEVYPYRCDMGEGTVTIAQSVSLKLTYSRDSAAKVSAKLLAQDWLPGSLPEFANRGQFEGEYEAPADSVSAAQPDVAYLIITTNAVASLAELADFVLLKESRGLTVNVVTIESFVVLPGPDLADQIRSYLQANYESWGLKYLLLIGTPDPDHPDSSDTVGTVPMKLCFPQSYYTDRPPDEVEAATDYYFADLTGDWDADGDGYYGEAFSTIWGYTGDLVPGGIDYAPELLVGRIPFESTAQAASCLANIVAYETATDNYDWDTPAALDWRNKVFCITHRFDENTPVYQLSKHLRDLTGPGGYQLFVAHDEDYALTPPADLVGYTNSDILSEWQNRYGVVLWACHGKDTYAEDVFHASQCGALPQDAPSIVLQTCCLTGYPELSGSLSAELMKNGVVGTICATRTTWYVGGWDGPYVKGGMLDMGYFMALELLGKRRALGEVLQNMRNTYYSLSWGGNGYHGANLMAFNLYGEPACSLGVLRVTTEGLPGGTKGEDYIAGLSAAGGVEPYAWSLAGGETPPGLTLSTTGALFGRPVYWGTCTFTVKVTDATGACSSKELSFYAKKPKKSSGCALAPAADSGNMLALALAFVLLLAWRRRVSCMSG